MNEVRAALGATEIFSGLSERVLDLLAGAAIRRDVPAETMLWTQGAPRRALFVILDGSVEISREKDGAIEPLSVEGRGEAVGVGALLHTPSTRPRRGRSRTSPSSSSRAPRCGLG